jgi:chemotaxis protein CheC
MTAGWSELERDALAEAFNVGVGSAAAVLSNMVGSEVLLSVPELRVVNKSAALTAFGLAPEDRVCAVVQPYGGAFESRAVLMFTEAKSFDLVRAVVPGYVADLSMSEMAQDALIEVGNLVLDACLNAVGELLDCALTTRVPTLVKGGAAGVLAELEGEEMMLLHMLFAIRDKNIDGYVGFLLDAQALAALHGAVRAFLSAHL